MFAAQRKNAGLDLEAVEMAARAGLHRAGAAILTALLSESGGHAPRVACPCGAQARYHDQRPKHLLTALGPFNGNALTMFAPGANRAKAHGIANWMWQGRSVLQGCAA